MLHVHLREMYFLLWVTWLAAVLVLAESLCSLCFLVHPLLSCSTHIESGVLKSLVIVKELSTVPSDSSSFCIMYLGLCCLIPVCV